MKVGYINNKKGKIMIVYIAKYNKIVDTDYGDEENEEDYEDNSLIKTKGNL